MSKSACRKEIVMPTVLAVCAHPDDAEIKIGGTLIRLVKLGWDVHIATFTAGDCGSAEEKPNVIAARRKKEAETAAAFIGATYHCLGFEDLRYFDDDSTRGAVTALIREVRPDCVITHFPVDYMPDHITASAVTRGSIFCAPIPNYTAGKSASFPATESLAALFYFTPLGGVDFFGNPLKPEFYVDTTSVEDVKAEALGKHVSQREWLRRQHGMDQYIEEMRENDHAAGEVAGVGYAEGFTMHRGHAYPQTELLQKALGIIKP